MNRQYRRKKIKKIYQKSNDSYPLIRIEFLYPQKNLAMYTTSKKTLLCFSLQGPLPGHFLGDVPEMIDEIYVQFYNNWCKISNPRVFYDFLRKWLDYSKKTNGPMVYVGVPSAPRAAGAGYVTPEFLKGKEC